MNFTPHKINECINYKFYQTPTALFEFEEYKDKVTLAGKILYGFLLSRLNLSLQNNWYDEESNVYLIFTRTEAMKKLNLSDKTITKAFNSLKETGLIYEKKQGMGRPNLIYVGKINLPSNLDTLRIVKSPIHESEILRGKYIDNRYIDNNINNISSSIFNTEDLRLIKSNCNLNNFKDDDKLILEDVIDNLYNADKLKINNIFIDNVKIKEKLKLLTENNLISLLNTLKTTSDIKNINSYSMTCLYNLLGNKLYVNNIKEVVKKKVTNLIKGRDYDNGYLETFYDNN